MDLYKMWNGVFTLLFLVLFILVSYFFYLNNMIITTITLFDFILVILATFRLTRLIVYDKIFNFAREYFANYKKKGLKMTVHELLICPWCTSIWVALILIVLYYTTPFTWLLLLILAVSGAASLLQVLSKFLASNLKK